MTHAQRALACLLAAGLGSLPARASDSVAAPSAASPPRGERSAGTRVIEPQALAAKRFRLAGFEQETASHAARAVANWVVDSGDSQGMAFAIVDKIDAKVFVFDADGRLRGASPALLGLAIGDESVPDIGNRPLSTIRPQERTTPAGRFVATLGRNLRGKEILWVDYAGAVSMHPVVSANAAERRLQRMASPSPQDNRISYGCINVSAAFFDKVVLPAFTGAGGIVYVLPETSSAQLMFGAYDVAVPAGL